MSRQERLRTDLSLDLAMINWSAVQSSQYGIGRFALPANSVFIASECGSNFANQIVYGNVYMLSDFNLAYCTWYFATGTLVLCWFFCNYDSGANAVMHRTVLCFLQQDYSLYSNPPTGYNSLSQQHHSPAAAAYGSQPYLASNAIGSAAGAQLLEWHRL